MKKVFLTSGIVLCMVAQPSYADIASSATSASCVENTLGVDDGATSFEIKWKPVISGDITLQDYYKTSASGSYTAPTTTVLDVSGGDKKLYSRYDDSLYSTSAYATAGGNTGKVSTLYRNPALTGYTFQGFYNAEQVRNSCSASGTQMINSSGTVQPAALTAVTSQGGTATWYAYYTGVLNTISLDKNSSNGGSTDASPTTLYTKYGDGAYLSEANRTSCTSKMTTSANPLSTAAGGKTYTLTMTKNASSVGHADSDVTITSTSSTTPAATFKGFYSAQTGGTQYIDANKKITTQGNSRAASITSTDTWYAQYNCATATTYTPTMSGYNFTGWYDAATNGNQVTNFCLTADKTVYAQWTAKQYNVTYDPGSHGTCSSGCNDDGVHVYTNDATYDQNYTARTFAGVNFSENQGYTFSNWTSSENGGGEVYTGDTPWTRTGPLTLYAEYTPNTSGTITINYKIWPNASNPTDVTNGSPTSVYSIYGDGIYNSSNTKVTTITKPSKYGYVFQGVYNEKNIYNSGTVVGTQMIDGTGAVLPAAATDVPTSGATKTWYSRWRPALSGAITLNSDLWESSSVSSAADTLPTYTTFYSAYDYYMYRNAKPTENNYLTAPSGSSCQSGQPCKVTAITKPTKACYTFEGYYTTKNIFGEAASGTQVINSSGNFLAAAKTRAAHDNDTATYYARWTGAPYSISYGCGDGATGGTAPDSSSVTYRGTYTIPENTGNCAKTGHDFGGWHCNYVLDSGDASTSGTGNYDVLDTGTYNVCGNSSCSAIWSAKSYSSVTYTCGTGTGTPNVTGNPSTPTYNSSYTFAASPSCTKTGYSLNNWSCNNSVGSRAFGSSATWVWDTTATCDATWTANKYNVTYNVGAHGTCPNATCTDTNHKQHVYSNDATYDQNYTAKTYANVGFTQSTGYTYRGWSSAENATATYDQQTDSWSVSNAWSGETPWKRTGPLEVYAIYSPNVSGAITINSLLWKAENDSYAVGTYAAPATVYSRYGEGIYSSSDAAKAGGSNDKVESLTTKPAKTGYTFAGIYDKKQILHTDVTSGSTLVVNTTDTGTFTTSAATRVSTSGGTAAWYTRWLPVIGTVTLDNKVYDTAGTNATTNSSPTTVFSAFDYAMYSGDYAKPTTGTTETLYYNAPSAGNCVSGTPCKITSITPPTATGYTFAGFYTTQINAGASTSNKTKVINADGTFTNDAKIQRTGTSTGTWYAYYTKNQHTVSYTCGTKPSGASGTITGSAPSVSSNNATYNTSFTLSNTANTCALTGYDFAGWACDYKLTDGTHTSTNYSKNQTVTFKVDNDVVCGARWTARTITLDYNANGGNANGRPDGSAWSNDSVGTCVYDSTFVLPTAPKKQGHTFCGWCAGSNCSGTCN